MQYPKMQTQPRTTVTVPQLNGGVNLCDLPNCVEDNQLTACSNVWWHNGVLRTRPGLTVKQEGTLPVGATGEATRFVTSSRVSDREVLLGQFREPPAGTIAGTFWGYSLDLDNGVVNLGQRIGVSPNEDGSWSAFGIKASKGSETDYYFFLSDGSILRQGEKTDDGAERQLIEAEPYVPLVMVNGKGWDGTSNYSDNVNGVLYEGYNMLTGKYKCTFTTDGNSSIFGVPKNSDDVSILSVQMMVGESDVRTICLEDIKNGGGWVKITAEEAGEDAQTFFPDETSLEVAYRGGSGKISFCMRKVNSASAIIWHPPIVVSNNLTIIAEEEAAEQRDTICRMTRATWFGGDRSGVNGGTRLFVCGNPDKPNLVHWSDVNNPLYFPENNYAYIGSGDEAVTGFGKQSDLLVMFKEHEIYAAQYVAGTDFTYEDVISGAVTDVAANLARFPITPLHPTIGCDCPDTVRLVNNKLVWATSDKHIYIMPSVNQWSERNVRDITARIRPHLDGQTADSLKGAMAGEYNGYYTLLVDKTLYLLDAGNSAFNSYAYYSSEKKATMSLPWYIWELDSGTDEWVTTVSDGERLCIMKQPAYMPLYGGQEWTLYSLQGNTDDGRPIACSFSTKQYDFERADARKSIQQVYISVGDTEGCRIRVGYVTDRYTAEDAFVIECDGETNGSVQPYRLTPNIHMVQRFGIRLEAENPMTVAGLTIKYKNQGVVR